MSQPASQPSRLWVKLMPCGMPLSKAVSWAGHFSPSWRPSLLSLSLDLDSCRNAKGNHWCCERAPARHLRTALSTRLSTPEMKRPCLCKACRSNVEWSVVSRRHDADAFPGTTELAWIFTRGQGDAAAGPSSVCVTFASILVTESWRGCQSCRRSV